MPKLKAPEGTTGASFNGESFKVDAKGFVNVPDEAVADLFAHGFTTVPEKAAKAEQPAE